jgi:hypothetical protein
MPSSPPPLEVLLARWSEPWVGTEAAIDHLSSAGKEWLAINSDRKLGEVRWVLTAAELGKDA